MGKRRDKFFIGKHEQTTTFKLTPASDAVAPSQMENPELTNVVDVTEQELNEREQYGIYYNDNYNYMSHMKAKDERLDVGLVDRTEITVPKDSIYVSSNILEVKGRELKLDLRRNDASFADVPHSSVDIDEDIDADLLEALNMEEMDDDQSGDEEEIYNRLEDNFLELAGGVDMPEGRRIYEEMRKTAHTLSSDDDKSDDESEIDVHDHDSKAFIGQETIFDDTDEEDEDGEAFNDDQPDEILLNSLANEYMATKEQNQREKPDEESKQRSLAAFERQEAENVDKSAHIEVEVRSKRPRWDCESIISTYSTLYNHPTIIGAPLRRKSPGLSKRDIKKLNAESKMEVETMSTRSSMRASTTRQRGETTEERRERKQAIKEERRERRVERKANKNAFKDEKKRMDAQRKHVVVDGRPLQ